MGSVWSDTIKLPSFDPLEHALNTDVLIVGGGLAGLLCAWRLQQLGVDHALVEADTVCGGVTKDTTAKITAQHGLIYAKLGREAAKGYLDANLAALAHYRKLSGEIDCDFQHRDSFVYSRTDLSELEEESSALKALGFPVELEFCPPLPFSVAGALRFPDQAQFHPLKLVAALLPKLRIYEHTPVRSLSPHRAVTDRVAIQAKKVIVATHFPILNRHGSYFIKLYQHRSYALALENAPDLGGMYVDAALDGLSFRNYNGLLLLGGGGGRTGKPMGGWEALETFARRHWPKARVKYRWATQDCMSLDGVPYIGQYARTTPDLYVATGFNGWGMTSSMVAALLLADLVTGQENPWAGLFSPSRSMLHPQLTANVAHSALGLLTPTTPRCPHMGCALKWNEAENTWDCPCHGSRFTKEGRLLDDPATKDMKRGKPRHS